MKEGDTMNFYDKVHGLVKDLKETPEYTNYILVKEKVKNDRELCEKIKEFKEDQRKEQMKYINGEKIVEDIQQELQQKYSIIIRNPLAVEFFQAEIKLDVLLADVQKILSEGLKDAIDF